MDDVQRRAASLAALVATETERSMTTPGCAGYVPDYRLDGCPGQPLAGPRSAKAAHLRGVANKLVGPEWEWRIIEYAGGDAVFVITRYNPEERSATR